MAGGKVVQHIDVAVQAGGRVPRAEIPLQGGGVAGGELAESFHPHVPEHGFRHPADDVVMHRRAGAVHQNHQRHGPGGPQHGGNPPRHAKIHRLAPQCGSRQLQSPSQQGDEQDERQAWNVPAVFQIQPEKGLPRLHWPASSASSGWLATQPPLVSHSCTSVSWGYFFARYSLFFSHPARNWGSLWSLS